MITTKELAKIINKRYDLPYNESLHISKELINDFRNDFKSNNPEEVLKALES